jgi:hypothetical protein
MTSHQQQAFEAPLVGRRGDSLTTWTTPPWNFALSFNR